MLAPLLWNVGRVEVIALAGAVWSRNGAPKGKSVLKLQWARLPVRAVWSLINYLLDSEHFGRVSGHHKAS